MFLQPSLGQPRPARLGTAHRRQADLLAIPGVPACIRLLVPDGVGDRPSAAQYVQYGKSICTYVGTYCNSACPNTMLYVQWDLRTYVRICYCTTQPRQCRSTEVKYIRMYVRTYVRSTYVRLYGAGMPAWKLIGRSWPVPSELGKEARDVAGRGDVQERLSSAVYHAHTLLGQTVGCAYIAVCAYVRSYVACKLVSLRWFPVWSWHSSWRPGTRPGSGPGWFRHCSCQHPSGTRVPRAPHQRLRLQVMHQPEHALPQLLNVPA